MVQCHTPLLRAIFAWLYTHTSQKVLKTTRGSPIHAISRVQLKEYQKSFDSVDDFDFDDPESDS